MDEGAIRAYIDGEGRRLVGALTLTCGDRGLAEEAVFDALARAWESERRGKQIDVLAAFVRTVAVRNLAKHRRRLGRQRRAVARLSGPPGPALGDPGHAVAGSVDLDAAMAKLSGRQRQVVALHYHLDLPVDEVAAVLGVSPGTVKTQLHRARTHLETHLRFAESTTVPGGAA